MALPPNLLGVLPYKQDVGLRNEGSSTASGAARDGHDPSRFESIERPAGGGLAQPVRASGLHPEGRPFDPDSPHHSRIRNTPQRRQYLRNYQRTWMQRRRALFLAGKSCECCGSSSQLEIHHRDPHEKTSHRIWSWSLPRIRAELAKCQILCNPCHAFITSARKSNGREAFCRRGVEFNKKPNLKKPWGASITFHGRTIWLGYHSTPEDAARAYDAKALELYGELAVLNFPYIPIRTEVTQ